MDGRYRRPGIRIELPYSGETFKVRDKRVVRGWLPSQYITRLEAWLVRPGEVRRLLKILPGLVRFIGVNELEVHVRVSSLIWQLNAAN